LTFEYENKKHEEQEEQRRLRDQIRGEEKAQREYEKAMKDAADEKNGTSKHLIKQGKKWGRTKEKN
jgi:GrpB-like predicted nucleotidyltransferase (UPF0157 family)